MLDEIINTPESLGVTPRYLLQHHAISRSIHSLSATAKKLTAMAMALLPTDLSSLTAAFTFTEFCNALGYSKSGESFRLFKAAVDECVDNKIRIEIMSSKPGKKVRETYTWFTYSKIDEGTGICKMSFSPHLASALLEMKRVYAKINLLDIGRLQSMYAIRLFELTKSYESLAGKDGNEQGAWYVEYPVTEFRQLFDLSDDVYKETRRFRQFVIERPVKEINKAGIGLEIETEGVKQGRRLHSLRLNCKQTPRTPKAKRGRPKKEMGTPAPQLELADSSTRLETRQEKEMEHLKELYPDEFEALYAAELSKPSMFSPESDFRKLAAEGIALAQLRSKYGIVK